MLFYNTDRGVEFALSFRDVNEYRRARSVLASMGLLDRAAAQEIANSRQELVLVDDETFSAFGKNMSEG